MIHIHMPFYIVTCFLFTNITSQVLAENPSSKTHFLVQLMGTDVRIVVDAPQSDELKKALNLAHKEGVRLNKVFSDWDAESELSHFSRSSQFGKPFPLSEELLNILLFSQSLARKSGGAFDVTLGPLSRLWRIARHQKKFPDRNRIENTLLRTGYKKLEINESNSSARLLAQGMVLDLGGIAKGYIADRMLEVMKRRGFSRCLIDAGGDLTIGDPPRNQKGWQISVGGVSDPRIPELELANCAVATSGDIEQYLEINGKRYSHLIDPRTGKGIEGRKQVTFVAENGMIADAYASTCLVLGHEKSVPILNGLPFYKLYSVILDDSSNAFQIFELHSGTED